VSGPILVVEPDAALAAVLDQVLSQAGQLDVRATEPAALQEAVASTSPRLVILDLDVPGGDGIDVLATIAPWVEGAAKLPVIAIVGASAADARRRARAAGARDFLSKPLDPTEVAARVENVLAATDLAQRVGKGTEALDEARFEALERLARAAEYRDDATYEHPQRVGRTSAQLAERLGLGSEQVDLIRMAAPLHDVGKVGVPDRILLKPGRLTAGEFELMKTHTLVGAEILAGSTWPVIQTAHAIALTHHERWDGTGYPQGLEGSAIPQVGRIVIVADNFDALTHNRPYAEAWDAERAAAEIRRQSGQHFDPEVVEAFDALDPAALLAPV
jgi:putative two-component system response regulator